MCQKAYLRLQSECIVRFRWRLLFAPRARVDDFNVTVADANGVLGVQTPPENNWIGYFKLILNSSWKYSNSNLFFFHQPPDPRNVLLRPPQQRRHGVFGRVAVVRPQGHGRTAFVGVGVIIKRTRREPIGLKGFLRAFSRENRARPP